MTLQAVKLIVFLGNPGKEYEKARHNLGFWVGDRLIEELKVRWQDKKEFEYAKFEGSYLLKPKEFVNNAGETIAKFVRYLSLRIKELVVVRDDLDLGVGTLRIRFNGESGGHKGVESIIKSFGANFFHIKLGIGRDENLDPTTYVLSPPKSFERKILERVVAEAVLILKDYLEKGSSLEVKTMTISPKLKNSEK